MKTLETIQDDYRAGKYSSRYKFENPELLKQLREDIYAALEEKYKIPLNIANLVEEYAFEYSEDYFKELNDMAQLAAKIIEVYKEGK